jgi:hypothetical protein
MGAFTSTLSAMGPSRQLRCLWLQNGPLPDGVQASALVGKRLRRAGANPGSVRRLSRGSPHWPRRSALRALPGRRGAAGRHTAERRNLIQVKSLGFAHTLSVRARATGGGPR